MRSRVAEETRQAQAEAESRLSMSERLALLDQANRLAIDLYAAVHQVTTDEAARLLASRKDG
ncbi:MAG TPA: hypothetical protein VHL58_18955 [Thermoanaerobaculia bacterium]|nr:hypothetical protein [Thermoanaerobaculia bacterium]